MIEIDERRPWNGNAHVLLIGPGAAGKSTTGASLAPLINYNLIDLDQEFVRRNGRIDAFIGSEGYENYKTLNSALAQEIVIASKCKILLVTSSGFLAPDNPPSVIKVNMELLAESYSICLLPSRIFERAASIIVDRQLKRPFARTREREDEVVRARFHVYMGLGDLIVFSEASPHDIAHAIADRIES